MTTQSNPFYAVSPDVVFESFDDEVIIINMVSGSYFALDETARSIWKQAESGLSRDAIIAATQARYEGEAPLIAEAVRVLLDDLEREGLLVRAPEKALPTTQAESDSSNGARSPFQTPGLSKFTDMQDLLLLDPIHEVDEQGWPYARAATETAATETVAASSAPKGEPGSAA